MDRGSSKDAADLWISAMDKTAACFIGHGDAFRFVGAIESMVNVRPDRPLLTSLTAVPWPPETTLEIDNVGTNH